MNIIFDNFNKFVDHGNVVIQNNKLTVDGNITLNHKESISYPTIIDNRNNTGKINLYFRSDISYYNKKRITKTVHDEIIVFYASIDGITFERCADIILHGNSACHNFLVYHEKNIDSPHYNKFFGIGGKHNPKFIIDTRHPKSCVSQNKYIQIDGNSEQCKFLKGKNGKITVVSPYEYSECYANGLHMFESDNGIKFNLKQKLPFINGFDNEDNCDGYYGFGVFDSISSLVYFNGKYILYNRANPKIYHRYVKYAISDDLISWSKFKIINIENMNYNNSIIYSPNIKKFNNILISVSNVIEIRNMHVVNCGMLLLSSDDGINWKKHNYILNFNIDNLQSKNITNNTIHSLMNLSANGDILCMNGNMYFYVCHVQNIIKRYKLEYNRLFYISNTNDTVQSTFLTKKIEVDNKMIKINCLVDDDGFVKIEIINSNNDIVCKFDDHDIITKGDYYDKILTWNGKDSVEDKYMYIKCSFKNAQIYSFSGKNIYL